MDIKKINAGGQQIAYRESSGTGPAVMLIHGNSASSLTFEAQLTGEFGQKYRVVAMDLPGHGESDRAADPASTYHMPGYAAVVADVGGRSFRLGGWGQVTLAVGRWGGGWASGVRDVWWGFSGGFAWGGRGIQRGVWMGLPGFRVRPRLCAVVAGSALGCGGKRTVSLGRPLHGLPGALVSFR